MVRIQTNFLPYDLVLFTKFTQLRQVLKIALAKNVQMCSMSTYVHAFYYDSFLFFTPSAFQD